MAAREILILNKGVQMISIGLFPKCSMPGYGIQVSKCCLNSRGGKLTPTLTYRVVPNPASESVTIVASNDIQLIRMFDLAGRNLAVKYDLQREKATIDLIPLHQGVYIIQLRDVHGNTSSQKIVIARP